MEEREKIPVGNQVRTYIGQSQKRNTNGKSRLIVSKLIVEGKCNSSNVVDENGEPRVVDGVFLNLGFHAVLLKIQVRRPQTENLVGSHS